MGTHIVAIPQLGPPDQWPACLRRAGLFPLRLTHGVERELVDEFLYRLYGMYLAVLAARMAASRGDQAVHVDSLFPDQPWPWPRNPFPWDDFVGPLPGDTIRNQPRLRPGGSPGWRWPQDFVQDLVRWARALDWMPGPAEVSWAELALDDEAFAGRALPASPDHRLWGTRLPLGERAQILRKAAGVVERHLLPYTRRPPRAPPRAFRSLPRSAAARQVRAVALRARSAWSMGRHRALGAGARASAAAVGRDTRGTTTPRRVHVVRGSRPGSRRAARCSFPRTGAQERRRCRPGSVGTAPPPKPSRPRAPRCLAGARPPPP